MAAFLGLLIGGIGPATAATTPGTGSDPPTVHITATGADPAEVQVEPGQTVVWINESGAKRSIVADDASFDSGSLASGDRFQFAFTEPGTVKYTITPAPGGSGTVVVSAATAAPTPAPTGTPPTAPTGFAYTGAGSALTGAAGAFALALGVGLVLSARRIGLMAYSGLSYFLAPDDLLPSRRHRRVRRDRARRGSDL